MTQIHQKLCYASEMVSGILLICHSVHSSVRPYRNSQCPPDHLLKLLTFTSVFNYTTLIRSVKSKAKGHPCRGTEALYRSYGP